MATELNGLGDTQATARAGDSAEEKSDECKRKRKGGPKVKSGCLTCKQRRVKCDERKPICKRCVRFGVQCDGYAKPVVKVIKHTGPRLLIPKDIIRANPLRVQQIYSGPEFSGEVEARYFRFYCENVAAQLSGPVETTLWERIIPQAVETEPIIKHAVVAVAALNRSRIDAAKGIGMSNPHHQYALLQYGKALKKIRDTLTNGVKDPRRSLMACLLVFCLESLQGYQTSASNQASVGVALLQRWCLANPGNFKRIEEDICHGLASLDLQAMLFLDSLQGPIHRELMKGAAEVMVFRPMILESLKDCYIYLQLVMRHCYHFIAAAHAEMNPQQAAQTTETTYHDDPMDFQSGNAAWASILEASAETPENILKDRDACIENVHRWERASREHMEEALSSEKDSDEYMVAAMLRIQVAMALVALGTAFSKSEMDYDNFIPEFNTITTFSESIHPALVARDRGSRFHFNIGILPGLCQVGMWCRQSAIRARAIHLLQRAPEIQEGVWNSASLGRFVNFLRTAEESGADEDGFVPASKRISWLGSSVSLYEKIAQVRKFQQDGTIKEYVKTSDHITRWGEVWDEI